MKQNKYDDPSFFASYSWMSRSIGGLEAAGELEVIVLRRLMSLLKSIRKSLNIIEALERVFG